MLLAFLGLLGVTSCLYDSGSRCDPGQRFDSAAGLCVCDEAQNLIAGDLGCVSCGEHEVAGNDTCACAQGFARPSAGAACTDFPPALGTPCESNKDCPDATYDTCHLTSDTSGYCSNACTDSSSCAGGYACDTAATPSYCKRPPTGQGQSCASDDDCAGTDATWCEIFNTHVCYVQGCSLTKNDCFPGKECCDLSTASAGLMKNPICVDTGSCPGD
ncbi:MAG: hypothetical protein ABW061_01645 [Polyangiaceae bacterium]